jgi:hypothetical protein
MSDDFDWNDYTDESDDEGVIRESKKIENISNPIKAHTGIKQESKFRSKNSI